MRQEAVLQKRNNLDLLRGIGIVGIVLYHTFPSVFPGGFLGVPLFFVLSGYLMFVTSDLNLQQGNFRISAYYKKRIIRILPSLFIMVMGVCCYLTLFQNSRLIGIRREIYSIFLGYDNWWQIWQHASYFSKLSSVSPFTHLWFLAVEIQFYLLWPALFMLYQKGCCRIGGKKMCFFFLGLALLSAGRMFCLYAPGEDPSRVYYGTDTMAFPLFIGMFLGAVRQQYPRICFPVRAKTATTISLCFIVTLIVLFVWIDGQYAFLYQGGLFMISLSFAGIIHLLENQEKTTATLFHTPLLDLLGKRSYPIYLWHYPIITLLL